MPANDDLITLNEDTVASADASGGVLANDTPNPGLTVTELNGNAADVGGTGVDTAHGHVILNSDGSYTYTPAANFNGTDSFSYTASDGETTTTSATVNITVNAVNDPPAVADDTATTAEDTPVTTGNVLANDTDVDNTLTPSNITAHDATSAHGGTVVSNGDGTFTYTPAANYNGPDSFTYTVDDGHGGSASATVNVTVTPVNDAPVAADDVGTMTEDDASMLFDVRSNDTLDPDAGASNTIAVFEPVIAANTLGIDGTDLSVGVSGGKVDVHLLGTDWQKMQAGETLEITIPYGLFGNGITDASGANLVVTVMGVNDAPVANDDTATTTKNMPVTTVNVLANDTDVDNTLTPSNITAFDATSVHGGTVVNNGDGTFTYMPATNFTGSDSFTYTINDGAGGVDTATVTVNVEGNNNGHHHHHHHHHHHENEHHHDRWDGHDRWESNNNRQHHDRQDDHGWMNGSANNDVFGHEDHQNGSSNSHGSNNSNQWSQNGSHSWGGGSWNGGSALELAHLEHHTSHNLH
jgi:large repetitive protein